MGTMSPPCAKGDISWPREISRIYAPYSGAESMGMINSCEAAPTTWIDTRVPRRVIELVSQLLIPVIGDDVLAG